MSLTSYSGLKQAVADLLNRTDLTSYIPDWITMAESALNRRLSASIMNVTTTITLTDSTYPLPEGFSGVQSLWLNINQGVPMEYVTPDVFDNITDVNGDPAYYTISNGQFYFAPPPSGTYSLRLRYKKNLTPLSDSDVNWVLQEHPDLYLYGTLIHSAPFLNDDARIVMWQGKFNELIDETNKYYSRVDRGSRLQTSSGLIDRGFNASGMSPWR